MTTQHTLLDDAAAMLEAHGFRAVADQIAECKKEIPNMPLSPSSETRFSFAEPGKYTVNAAPQVPARDAQGRDEPRNVLSSADNPAPAVAAPSSLPSSDGVKIAAELVTAYQALANIADEENTTLAGTVDRLHGAVIKAMEALKSSTYSATRFASPNVLEALRYILDNGIDDHWIEYQENVEAVRLARTLLANAADRQATDR